MKTVTLSTLVADTGETPRTLNHWTDIGILRVEGSTERKGRGNRRYYAAEPLYGERKYALLASALNKLRLPLVDIKHLIYAERLSFDPVAWLLRHADPAHAEISLKHRAQHEEDQKSFKGVIVHPFEAALAGEPNIFAVIAARPHDKVKPFHTVYLRQANSVMMGEDPVARANNKLMLNLMADNTSAVVLNLSKIFAPLFNIPTPIKGRKR